MRRRDPLGSTIRQENSSAQSQYCDSYSLDYLMKRQELNSSSSKRRLSFESTDSRLSIDVNEHGTSTEILLAHEVEHPVINVTT